MRADGREIISHPSECAYQPYSSSQHHVEKRKAGKALERLTQPTGRRGRKSGFSAFNPVCSAPRLSGAHQGTQTCMHPTLEQKATKYKYPGLSGADTLGPMSAGSPLQSPHLPSTVVLNQIIDQIPIWEPIKGKNKCL